MSSFSNFSLKGTRAKLEEKTQQINKGKEQLKNRGKLLSANLGSLKNAACQAEQVRLNTRAIAAIGEQLVKRFPDKEGGMFKKSVEGFRNMASNADCEAIKKEIQNKSMFENYKEQSKSKLGGKSRRRRKSRRSKKKRRKSKKRKSRRNRRKSRRRRRR